LSTRRRNRQTLLAGILLAGFASRALIPAGFMPASDRPFSLEICWDGFPAALLAHDESAPTDAMHSHSADMDSMPGHSMAGDPSHGATRSAHHHHPGTAPHNEHCVFASACSAGPVSQPPPADDISIARRLEVVELVSIAQAVRLVHLPQPRAPPRRLS
jgi:hypothetical protein